MTQFKDRSLTLNLAGELSAKKGLDGSWTIQLPPQGVPMGAYSTTGGTAGAVLNLPGTNEAAIHTRQVPVGTIVKPGDSLIITSTSGGPIRDQYWSMPGYSAVDEMMAVVFTSLPCSDNTLRPPALGSGIMTILRTLPFVRSQINYSLLPSVIDIDSLPIDWAGWDQGKPTFDYYERIFGGFCGDAFQGWETANKTPDFQHPGYGTNLAYLVSQALVMLCSTAPVEQKKKLAELMVQWGLDIAGAHIDGRSNTTNGGHMQGRKALVALAFHLLGIKDTWWIVGKRFAEDTTFYTREPNAWFFGWKHGYQCYENEPRFLHSAPETWTTDSRGQTYRAGTYINQVCGANVGAALAMKLMGCENLMGPSYMGMMEQWMKGPPASANDRLKAVGVNNQWGTDFTNVRALGTCREAYKKYYPNFSSLQLL